MKRNTESFVRDSNIIHNNKYDYSRTIYVNNRSKVAIICPIHGIFFQIPNSHLLGSGCVPCSIIKRSRTHLLNQYTFIEKAMKSFPEYDYSKSIYRRSKEKLIIGCPIHGEFHLKPNALFTGHGCPKCGISRLGDGVRLTQKEFINRATRIHGDHYDYSKAIYRLSHEKIEIICKKHGSFWQMVSNHLRGAGCMKCKSELFSKLRKYSFEMHVENFRKRHGDIYDYSKANYMDYNTKIEIICPKHGSFWQTTNTHSMGSGCPYCSKSKAEGRIREWLINNGVSFIPQHFFSDCKNIRYLYFDFFLSAYNTCIEYDGELHYKPYRKSSSGQKKLQETQRNDKLKNEYCEKMHIKLVRIPYWKRSKIEEILNNLLEEFK